MVRAGSDMCLDLFHLLQGFLVYALLKKAEEAAAVAVARAGAAVMVSTRGGGGEGSFRRSPLYLSDLSDHQSSITTTAEEEEEKGFIFYPSDIFEPTRKQ